MEDDKVRVDATVKSEMSEGTFLIIARLGIKFFNVIL